MFPNQLDLMNFILDFNEPADEIQVLSKLYFPSQN